MSSVNQIFGQLLRSVAEVSAFALQISFFPPASLFFSRISCQSRVVTFNHLQTELGASHSFSPSLFLHIQPVRMTHTVDHAFYSALAN